MRKIPQWEFDFYPLSLPRGHGFGYGPPIGAGVGRMVSPALLSPETRLPTRSARLLPLYQDGRVLRPCPRRAGGYTLLPRHHERRVSQSLATSIR